MTAPTYLHLYFLLDRSGSMETLATDIIGGVNSFVTQQRADGRDACMTFVQFDSQDPFEVMSDAVSLDAFTPLTAATFSPRGGTPLFDAIGGTIKRATEREAARKAAGEDPEEILVVIVTDGEENSSTNYSKDAIADLITAKEALGWTFAYLGANQDAFAVGRDLGFSRGNVSNFIADEDGTAAVFSDLSSNISRKRAMMRRGIAYSKADLLEDHTAQDDFEERA